MLIFTDGTDFAGEQVFDVKAEDLDPLNFGDEEEQPEVCRAATHCRRRGPRSERRDDVHRLRKHPKNSQLIIEQANQIIDEYQEQGFSPRQPLNSKGMRLPWVLEEIHRR